MDRHLFRCGAVLAVLGFFLGPLAAQDTQTMDQVQAVVIGLRTPQQALHVDEALRARPGVVLSRTDVHTQNLFLLIRHDAALDHVSVAQQLASMGLEVRCWTRAVRSDRPFQPLDAAHCSDQPLQK